MADGAAKHGSFGWRGWLGVAAGLSAAAGVVAVLVGVGWLLGFRPGATPQPTPTTSRLSNRDYGYCWDVGDPHPHHLGAYVSGDHLCAAAELQQASQTP
jgi:hypothetical protein